MMAMDSIHCYVDVVVFGPSIDATDVYKIVAKISQSQVDTRVMCIAVLAEVSDTVVARLVNAGIYDCWLASLPDSLFIEFLDSVCKIKSATDEAGTFKEQ